VRQDALTINGSIGNDTARVTVRDSSPVSPVPRGNDIGASILSVLDIANDGASLAPSSVPLGGPLRQYYGAFDLNNNDLIITDMSLAEVEDMARAGFNAGAWDGKGLTSTQAATGVLAGQVGLGVIENFLFDDDGVPETPDVPFVTSFAGESLIGGEILVKFTWYGDANLDGQVDFLDYAFTDTGAAGGGSGWLFGDFNYDATIDFIDYAFIDTGAAGFNVHGSLPEPATLGVLVAGGLGLLRRRRA
jgi:hypothetical protein